MTSSPLGLGSWLEQASRSASVTSQGSPKASEPPKKYDTDAAIEFLMDLDHDGRHDLAAIDPDTGKLECATFLANEKDQMRQWIEARQGKGVNLYASVNRARNDAPRNVRLNHEKRK